VILAALALAGATGPGFTISLERHGRVVHSLRAGRYAITIKDSSPIHDFHLRGPGVNKVITGVEFTGTRRVVVRLRPGTYVYLCDPHASIMRGRFTVR
jgi:plastocyanin